MHPSNRGERLFIKRCIKAKLRVACDRKLRQWGRINRYGKVLSWESGWRSDSSELVKSIRHHAVVNEGKHRQRVYRCGSSCCEWCVDNKYRKHRQRSEAMDAEFAFWKDGGYSTMDSED